MTLSTTDLVGLWLLLVANGVVLVTLVSFGIGQGSRGDEDAGGPQARATPTRIMIGTLAATLLFEIAICVLNLLNVFPWVLDG